MYDGLIEYGFCKNADGSFVKETITLRFDGNYAIINETIGSQIKTQICWVWELRDFLPKWAFEVK